MIKKKGQILPQPYSDEWYKLKNQVEERFDKDFNDVSLTNLGTVKEDWYDYILSAEPTKAELKDYFGEYNLTDKQFEEKHTEDEIEDAKVEVGDSKREVIWGTVFEAKDSMLADKIRDNAEKITNEIGLVVIDISDTDEANNYNTGVFLGSGSAGHDFYEAYWVPLYRLFGWVQFGTITKTKSNDGKHQRKKVYRTKCDLQ